MAIDQKIVEKLIKTGLSEKEARIYAVLLDIGGGYPAAISQAAQVNRSTTYAILTELSIKGLVTEIRRKKKMYYQLEKPQKLLRYTEQGIRLAEDQLEYAKNVMPDLEGLFSATGYRPRVRFFEGEDGIMQVYEDHVNGDMQYEMLGFSNVADLTTFIPHSFLRTYIRKKEEFGVTSRGIFPDTERDINYNDTFYAHVDKKIWPELRFIPAEQFPYHSEITVYRNDRVSIVNFHEKQLIGVIIEDKTTHDMMRMIFNLAWQGLSE